MIVIIPADRAVKGATQIEGKRVLLSIWAVSFHLGPATSTEPEREAQIEELVRQSRKQLESNFPTPTKRSTRSKRAPVKSGAASEKPPGSVWFKSESSPRLPIGKIALAAQRPTGKGAIAAGMSRPEFATPPCREPI